jgi:Tol biopolymer transport system component
MKQKLMLAVTAIIIFTLFLAGCAKTETPVKVTEPILEETGTTNAIVPETQVTSETAQETTVPTANEIIFSSLNNDQGTIYICNPDGSNMQKLIEGGINTSPSWNMQHTKIVFNSLDPASGVGSLYIYDMESKSKTLLLKGFSPRDPSFSPDGNTIVFADFVEDGSENAEIYTIIIDGNNLTKLTDNPARDYLPKYSPDGKTIVFSSERDGNIQLYTVNSSGGNVKRLMKNEFTDNCGSFSPDGHIIIFNSDRGGSSDIYAVSSDGIAEPKNLTSNSAGNYEPCYSPDGSSVVYRSNKGLTDSMSYDIFVMTADGKNQINITPDLSNTNEFNPSW